jgi:hypothetical protein
MDCAFMVGLLVPVMVTLVSAGGSGNVSYVEQTEEPSIGTVSVGGLNKANVRILKTRRTTAPTPRP